MSLRAARASAFLLLLLALLPSACVKRVPVSAGGDRSLEAGALQRLGQPLELPAGARMSWEFGDGARADGPQTEHAWQRPGEYALRVEIVDPDGERRADQVRVRVTRPTLERAAPASARVVLRLVRPAAEGAGLAHVPLLIERLVTDGQEANALLAGVRQGLGFDPFSAAGWRTAGLDPEGELAWIGLDAPGDAGRAVGLLVAAARDEPVLQAHLGRTLGGAEGGRWQPRADAPGLQELHAVEDGRLLGLAVQARGYLWLALTDAQGVGITDAEQVLGALLQADGPRLAELSAWQEAGWQRPPGALSLWLRALTDELPPIVRAALGSLRLDLDLSPAAVSLDGWLALRGPEAASLAAVARARLAPPDWTGRVPAGSHALLKLSLDAGGLARLVAGWLGQAEGWQRSQAALDQLSAQTGLGLRTDVLDNLGDSYLLAVRFRPQAVWSALARPDGQVAPALAELLDGLLLVQVRDAERLRGALEALATRPGVQPWVRPLPAAADGAARFALAPGGQGLTLALRPGLLLVGLPGGWGEPAGEPARGLTAGAGLAAPDHQVLAVDLERLRADLQTGGADEQDGAAAVVRSFVVSALARLGGLGVAELDLRFVPEGLRLLGGLRF